MQHSPHMFFTLLYQISITCAIFVLQSVLDVGEALASFGNCHFPEHSNEGRAILAGDYKALLRRYLSSFGFMFAQPTKEQLPHDLQVGSQQ